MTGRKTEESGQSLVECAIILPLLVLVMSVVIEFGWIIMNRMNFDNMALVAVHANAKTDSGQAADFLEKYVRDNFDRFDDSSLTVSASTEVQTYYYDEYVEIQPAQTLAGTNVFRYSAYRNGYFLRNAVSDTDGKGAFPGYGQYDDANYKNNGQQGSG
ncbi:MAG: TadE/TadG family type IV pilus assembly protein [Eisenbergiella sp.]